MQWGEKRQQGEEVQFEMGYGPYGAQSMVRKSGNERGDRRVDGS
jgi:hypothetical protein